MLITLFARGLFGAKLRNVYRKLPTNILAYYFCTCHENHDFSQKKLHIKESNGNLKTESEVLASNKNVDLGMNDTNQFPQEPTTCCMSGCASCVWLEYAEKLSEYFKDGGESAIKEINERVNDPNIRAFLLHELRTMKL